MDVRQEMYTVMQRRIIAQMTDSIPAPVIIRQWNHNDFDLNEKTGSFKCLTVVFKGTLRTHAQTQSGEWGFRGRKR